MALHSNWVLCNELQSLVCISLYMFMVLPLFQAAVLFFFLVCLFWAFFCFVCFVFVYLLLLVSIVHDGLHVVSWEKPGDAIADSFEPAVIILLDDIDDGSFHKGQLILLILGIVIDGHNWKK